MAQILHRRATTAHAIRAEIQQLAEPTATLSRCYGINPKTIRKWRNRGTIEDTHMGPRAPCSTSLTPLEEAPAVTFRQKPLLSLDDCLYALQRKISSLTRSSLHRLYQRHGISQLPKASGQKRKKKPFKRYPIGYLHIDISEVRTGEGRAYLFVAADRTSEFIHTHLYRQVTRQITADFLEEMLKVLPYLASTVLTDNGVQFVKKVGTETYKPHIFDAVCFRHGIEHRLKKPFHPCTNGQVERMSRMIKEAKTRALHYASLDQLQSYLDDYLWAYNSARPLRALKGRERRRLDLSLTNGRKSPKDFMMTQPLLCGTKRLGIMNLENYFRT